MYTQRDITPVMNKFTTYSYDAWGHIHKDVKIKFVDAGHILGSAGVVLSIMEGVKKSW